MKLKSIQYSQYDGQPREWRLEDCTLGDINLIVGKNATGKTKALNIISDLANSLSGDSKQKLDTGDWDAAFERIGDQQLDIDSDSFAAANSVDTTTVPGTTGLVDIVNITFTDGADMDSVAVGESFRLKIIRDATNDSATGDAELVKVEIKET